MQVRTTAAALLVIALSGCITHGRYLVDRGAWSLLNQPVARGPSSGEARLRLVGPAVLRITPNNDGNSYRVDAFYGQLRVDGIERMRLPDDVTAINPVALATGFDRPPDVPPPFASDTAIDLVAKRFLLTRALVPARRTDADQESKSGPIHLHADALPPGPPPGSDPWVPVTTSKANGRVIGGAVTLSMGAVLGGVGAMLLTAFDCVGAAHSTDGDIGCGIAVTAGAVLAAFGGLHLITGAVLIGVGASGHPEQGGGGELRNHVVVPSGGLLPPAPAAPVGALPPVRGLRLGFRF